MFSSFDICLLASHNGPSVSHKQIQKKKKTPPDFAATMTCPPPPLPEKSEIDGASISHQNNSRILD